MRINAILLGLSLGVLVSVSAQQEVGESTKAVTNEVKNALDGVKTAIDGTGNPGSFTKRGRISLKKIEQFKRQRRSTPLLLPDIVLPQITTQKTAPELPVRPPAITTVAPVQQAPNTYTTTTATTQSAPPPSSVAPTQAPPPSSVAPTQAPPPSSVAPTQAPPTQAAPALPPNYNYPPYYPPAPAKKKEDDDDDEEDEDEEDEEDYDADDLKTRRRR
jgi:hypothetical protein